MDLAASLAARSVAINKSARLCWAARLTAMVQPDKFGGCEPPCVPKYRQPSVYRRRAHRKHFQQDRGFSTFRARAAYAWDRLFIYGTSGLAVADLQSQTNVTFGTVPVLGVYSGATHVASTSLTRPGWVGGGGAEYAFAANWSLKGEYLYMDFGTYSYSSPLIAETAPFGPGYSWGSSVREREQLVRIGLNYKFNWSPLLGKYQARAIPLAASAEE
jgi:opacity protein-like surface antigen